MVMLLQIRFLRVRTQRFIIIFLISLTVTASCGANQVQSGPNQKLLTVVFSKSFTNVPQAKVAFSKNGALILAAGAYDSVNIIHAGNFRSTAKIGFSGSLANAQLINEDKVFIANQDGLTQIQAINNHKQILLFKFPQGEKYAAISQDMNHIAYGGFIYAVNEAELQNPTVTHAVQSSLQFFGTDGILTAGFHDQRIVLRNLQNNKQRVFEADDPVTAAAMVTNDYLVAGTNKGECYLWNVSNNLQPGKPERKIQSIDRVNLVSADSENSVFAVSGTRSLQVFSVAPFRKLFETKTTNQIRAIAIKDNWLIIGEDDGKIQLWDFINGRLIGKHELKDDAIESLDIYVATPKKSSELLIVVGSYRGNVLLLKEQGKNRE
jgi:WD40 repeat protein